MDSNVKLLIWAVLFISGGLFIFFVKFSKILEKISAREKLKKEYDLSFERRDALMYHIGSCKEKDEIPVAKRLMLQLEDLDKQIDNLEEKLSKSFWHSLFASDGSKDISHIA